MLGLASNSEKYSSSCASASMLVALLSLALGVWVGPLALAISSLVGIVLAVTALIWGSRINKMSAPTIFPLLMVAVHLVFLITAGVLHSLLLAPLSNELVKMPRFQNRYEDPTGKFSLKGPAGWRYESLSGGDELGVLIRPESRAHYMGVSELSVLIRKLDYKPKSPDEFLKSMASGWTEKKVKGTRMFSTELGAADLLNHQKGVWSTLDVKRFWVPVRQVSLLGFKNNRYLCSVSAIGLKGHSTLSQVMCLGLFETVKIGPSEK